MRLRLALVAAALGGSGFTVEADPSTMTPILWPSSQVTMVLHDAGSADVTDGSDLAAIRDALEVWSAPGCTGFAFSDGGTSGTRGDDQDGVNRISFLESGWPGAADGAVALTTRVRDTATSPDTWSEVDIIINGQDFTWSTDGTVQTHDVQMTVTHELGHVLGLMHSSDPQTTMYFAARRGLTFQRTLAPDDVNGACFLYPAGVFHCTTDEECPLLHDFSSNERTGTRTRCQAGNCVAGGVGYGSDCFASADCTSGLCLTGIDSPASFDPGFCSQSCTLGGSDCPGNDLCDDPTGSPLCILGHDDCILDADCDGGANQPCAVDLDGRFRCAYLCVQDGHCSVVPGTVCHGGVSNDEPGFCRPPGPLPGGSSCEHGLECQSLYCAGPGPQPTCVGGSSGAGDGGSEPDGAIGGDSAGSGDQQDLGDGGPAGGGHVGSDPVSGGCGCRADSSVLAVLTLVPRRRRRSRNQRP